MPMMTRKAPQYGFTLTELMVALVINVLIFGGLLGIFVSNLNHYTTAINTNRLNQQLQAAMEIMTTDIRRAGYWSRASNNLATDTNTNPFQNSSAGTDITIGGAGNSCILLTYDHLKTGTLPTVSSSSDDDRYGFMLNGTALQERPWGGTFTCSAGNWENVTDPSVTITALTFTLTTQTVTTGLGTSAIVQRSVDITLTGQLTSNSAISKTLNEHVRIRNDKFTP